MAASKYTDGKNLKNVRADGFGEISVVQGRRVCVPFDSSFVNDGVNLVGGNPGTDMGCGDVKNFSRELKQRQSLVSKNPFPLSPTSMSMNVAV